MNRCKKELYHTTRNYVPNSSFCNVYSYINTPSDLDEEHNRRLKQRCIIPEISQPIITPKLDYLSTDTQNIINNIINQHHEVLAQNKHQLGRFRYFKVRALIDEGSKVNCKQPCRTRILPTSCKDNINIYRSEGLFEPSTGRQDTYCANITLVRRKTQVC